VREERHPRLAALRNDTGWERERDVCERGEEERRENKPSGLDCRSAGARAAREPSWREAPADGLSTCIARSGRALAPWPTVARSGRSVTTIPRPASTYLER
jgi:hypothetical protein